MKWKEIEGTNDKYKVSSSGLIKNVKNNRFIKPVLNYKGYMRVAIRIYGKVKILRVHRLVAQAFIPNPMNKPQVNHKNGNKLDNRVENLEWVSNKENYIHAIKNGLVNHREKPCALLYKGKEIMIFDSILQAEKITQTKYGDPYYRLTGQCKNNIKRLKDYKWVYL